ncbi:MAG: GPW/gp25 family protein [Myxococcales bacterium]|nr:GPW/gp25 family protein [Myxococcales bacterium]
MSDDRQRLGKGWRFPVSLQLAGGVGVSAFEANVRESIFVILGTAPGERVGRPEFGCMIHDLMFAPNNAATAALAKYYCETAIAKFEPRVRAVAIAASPSSSEPNRLDIKVAYVLADESTPRNLVYPFYLQESAS